MPHVTPLGIWIATGGSHGDVHPFLGIGRELRRRGHDVTLSVHPHFRGDVEAAGLRHFSLGEHIDFEAVLRNPDVMDARRGPRTVLKLVLDSIPSTVARLGEAWRDDPPDVVLAHHICIGVRWLCEARGLPLALATLSPLLWYSKQDPVPLAQRRPGGFHAALARLYFGAAWPVARAVLDVVINHARRRSGFPSQGDVFIRDIQGGDVTLGLWSPHFRPPTPGDPTNGRICGFPWYDRAEQTPALPDAVERFLANGSPPIVFALGTAAVHVPGDFFDLAAQACTRLRRRGILLVGRDDAASPHLPNGVLAVGYLPFSLILPRAAAVVHHGGIGSTGQSLRAGCPAVVVPHAHDQFHNALHVRRLGAGTLVARRGLTVASLASALDEILDRADVRQRAAALAARIAKESGAETAADAVECLAS